MALYRTRSYINENGERVKERIQLSAQEEADTLAEWAASEAEIAAHAIVVKRNKLIRYEKEKAIMAQIAQEIAAINNMDEAALDAAIDAMNQGQP